MSHDERHKTLTEAWQAVQREVVPLGGYSPWNEGFTTAVNKALNAILALRDGQRHCPPLPKHGPSCATRWVDDDHRPYPCDCGVTAPARTTS